VIQQDVLKRVFFIIIIKILKEILFFFEKKMHRGFYFYSMRIPTLNQKKNINSYAIGMKLLDLIESSWKE